MAGEGKLQSYFKRRCAEEGILWRKIAFEGVRGCPDTLIAKGGRMALIELKNTNGKGRLSEQQKRRIAEFADAGIKVFVEWTKEGIEDVIRSFG